MTQAPASLAGRVLRFGAAAVFGASLAACSLMPSFLGGGGAERPKPAELAPNPGLVGVRQTWMVRLPEINFPLVVNVSGSTVHVAAGDGTVLALDAATGREQWRGSAGGALAAGVGSDGRTAAVVTRANEVVALEAGRVLWRQRLPALSYTAPLVAGGRVFVLAGDRSVAAFDGQTGRRLWTQQRPGEPLVLRQSGVLLAVGDTLVAGQAGRLAGLNPANGSIRWEAPLAVARGTNDIERLVDLVGSVSRLGDTVCARAFQASVGCVDAARGTVVWTRPANGAEGVGGDEQNVFGTESDGKVMAWRRADGERSWMNDRLAFRGLSAPLVLGRSLVVGDAIGMVHFLSRDDGSLLDRVATDGSAIAAAPVRAGETLVVATRRGALYGFQPQ
jgi:outer membrane assembly lipoprotein YfgL